MAIKNHIILVLLLLVVGGFSPSFRDQVDFLDVGQGDSILFEDGSYQMLIDGGPGANLLEPLAQHMPWFDRTIDVVVLTHPQQDHMEGLLHVFQRYKVKLVIFPQVPYDSNLYQVWLGELERKNIPYRFAELGEQIQLHDIHVKILGPLHTVESQKVIHQDVNNASTVTRVDFHNKSFLLTGDMEKEMEQILLASLPDDLLNVDILKAGHHGSKTSTSEELLRKTSPEMVVISVGRDNKFHHPNQETLDRIGNIPIARTDQEGTVQFVWLNDEWRVRGEK